MDARNKRELIPIILSFLSAAMASNVSIDGYPYAGMLAGVVFGILAIVYGWKYVNNYGRNAVIFIGVVLSILLIIIEVGLLFFSLLFYAAY